jgi:hypothetical protein
MLSGLGRRARWTAGVAAAVFAGGALSVAMGAIPGSDGTFSGCVASNGALKVIDAEAGQTCPSGQQAVTWNQQGPPGATGPAGPGAVPLYYNNGGPPVAASPPAAHTIATINGLTFRATCWRNSADNSVINTLSVTSSTAFDLDEVIGGRANDTGAYTTGPADGDSRTSAVVNTTVSGSANFFRTFVSPSILTTPANAAHPGTYAITVYQLTDARSHSRRCAIRGNVMPATG